MREHDGAHLVGDAARQRERVRMHVSRGSEVADLAHVADVARAVVDARVHGGEDPAARRTQDGERRSRVGAGRHAEEVHHEPGASRELVRQHADETARQESLGGALHHAPFPSREHLEAVAPTRLDQRLVEARRAERLHHHRQRPAVVVDEAQATQIEVARVRDREQAAARVGGGAVEERPRLELERERHLVARARVRAARHLRDGHEQVAHRGSRDPPLVSRRQAIAVDPIEILHHHAPPDAQRVRAVGQRAEAGQHEGVRQARQQRDQPARGLHRAALEPVGQRASPHCA